MFARILPDGNIEPNVQGMQHIQSGWVRRCHAGQTAATGSNPVMKRQSRHSLVGQQPAGIRQGCYLVLMPDRGIVGVESELVEALAFRRGYTVGAGCIREPLLARVLAISAPEESLSGRQTA